MDLPVFEQVAEGLRGVVAPELGELRTRTHRYGIKVWFDTDEPPRVHYEAQVLGTRHVPEAKTLALEIGFHAEHGKREQNDEVLGALLKREKQWRRALGDDAIAGPFLGRADVWRRVSETWPDPDLSDPDLIVELVVRLGDYINAIEPARRSG